MNESDAECMESIGAGEAEKTIAGKHERITPVVAALLMERGLTHGFSLFV